MALPSSYTRLKYIESTGTQYIDTGYKANGNTRLIMDVQLTDANISNQWFYGGRDDLQVKAFGFFWINSAFALTFRTEQNNAVHTSSSANATKRMRIDHNKNTFSAPDFSYSFASQTFASNYNLFLLARNSGGTISMPIKAKLYSCKIYDNDTLVRDFVPCLNESGVAGMYDLVNGTFYGDAAGGAFTSDFVFPLLDSYTRLEYIQSSGTQYIDTGFKPNQNTRVVMDAQIVDFGTKGQFLFGARGKSYKPAFAFFYSTDGPSFKTAYNTASVKTTCTDFTARVFVDQNKNVCKVNGVTTTHTASTFQNTINMYLMASNENGTTGYYTMMRLYSCQIYDNGTLIRDFIPCRNNTSGVVGLYDLVNGTFYTNKGTGTFTAGPEIGHNYQIVNTATLDNALSATADAIREKAEHSQKIAWNPTTGFADAIEAISSGIKVATGTFTPTARGESIYNNPITVSGLGFKPSRVIFFSSNADDSCGIISADT